MLTVHRAQVFEVLGFPLENLSQGAHKEGRQKADELALHPPPIDPDTSEGAASRKRLLRAWVELSAWLVIFEKNSKTIFLSALDPKLIAEQRRR